MGLSAWGCAGPANGGAAGGRSVDSRFSWETLHLSDLLGESPSVHCELRRVFITQVTVRLCASSSVATRPRRQTATTPALPHSAAAGLALLG